MALINRVTRLFRADIHAVLDRIEEPELLLRQSLREMEEVHAGDEHRQKLLLHEQGELRRRESDLAEQLLRLDGELDLCFAAQREELARTLVRRKLELERQQERTKERSGRLQRELEGVGRQIAEQGRSLESLRQKVALLDDGVDEVEVGCGEPAVRGVSDDDVELALLRERQRRAQS